jgi:hypothetical protein
VVEVEVVMEMELLQVHQEDQAEEVEIVVHQEDQQEQEIVHQQVHHKEIQVERVVVMEQLIQLWEVEVEQEQLEEMQMLLHLHQHQHIKQVMVEQDQLIQYQDVQ